MTKSIALKPRMSEKAYAQSQELNVYVFEIPSSANKDTVARAVASQFDVSVTQVRIARTHSKKRRSYQRGGRVVRRGVSSGTVKAYVTLKDGDKLPIFAAVEEASEASGAKENK